MKKILIWDVSFKLANVGGPTGYLYNIHEYLKENPCEQIVFLSDLLPSCECQTASAKMKLKQRLLSNRFIGRLNDFLFVLWKDYHDSNLKLPKNVNLNEFDYIHFHQANDVRRFAKFLRNYKGKTIVTTHCPCPRTDELLTLKPKWYSFFRYWIIKQECKCYEKADYLMFPCEGSREPYEKNKMIKKIFANSEKKFFYVPSAIMDINIDQKKMQKYSDLGIPDNSFVITYFGRHNKIKGYDILKTVCKPLLDKYPNLYVLCAGRGPIEPLKHPHWIELGFVNNTHELLFQSDLYVLPNRETYFDLVVLEILRSGTIVFLSANGGNNYFGHYTENQRKGISFIDVENVKEISEKIEKMISLKRNDKKEFVACGESNRKLWEMDFQMPCYVNRYKKMVSSLK